MQSVVGLLRSDLDRMLEVASLDTKAKKLSKQKYLEKGKKKRNVQKKTQTQEFQIIIIIIIIIINGWSMGGARREGGVQVPIQFNNTCS